MNQPGSMGDPFPPGSPGVATSGLQPGGPSWIGVRGPVGATPVFDVARITPGDSVLSVVSPPSPIREGFGQSPTAAAFARNSQGGGTYPS
jgi:hypothetical protein